MNVVRALWIFVLLFSISPASKAEKLSLETDLIVPVLAKGSHLHLKRSNTFFDNFTLGISLATMTLRDWIIDTMPEAKGKDWHVDIIGTEFTFDYYFSDPNSGLFIGPVLALSQLNLHRHGSTSIAYEFQTGFRFGYLWRPWNSAFYFMPWGAAGVRGSLGGDFDVEGEAFPTGSPLGIVGSANIGYTF